MFAQQQTQQLVAARTRVVSSRYVFHIEETREQRKRDLNLSLNVFIFPILNAAGPST